MADSESPLSLAAIVVGSPIGGAVFGAIVGTLQSATPNEVGVDEYTFTFNPDAASFATVVGWLLGVVYEGFYKENALALLILVPLALFVFVLALTVF